MVWYLVLEKSRFGARLLGLRSTASFLESCQTSLLVKPVLAPGVPPAPLPALDVARTKHSIARSRCRIMCRMQALDLPLSIDSTRVPYAVR